jgi:multicomponent Na+:H+ antiporter subunit F
MFSESLALPPTVFFIAQILVALAMVLTLVRIIQGPSIPDRILALDLLASLIMAQCVLLVFSSRFISYLDVASAIAIVSFLATVAFARYLEKQEPEKP